MWCTLISQKVINPLNTLIQFKFRVTVFIDGNNSRLVKIFSSPLKKLFPMNIFLENYFFNSMGLKSFKMFFI